jgi:hypothetical protein
MIERRLGDGGNGQHAHVRANQSSWLEMKFKQAFTRTFGAQGFGGLG